MLSFGLVGYGYWGPNLARVINNLQGGKLYGVCDKDSANLEKCSKLYPHTKIFTDYDALLSSKDLDVIVIATPVNTHYMLAKKALECNKHVFIEKPITSNTREAVELKRIAEDNNCCLMSGHTFIYSPPVIRIKELLSAGAIGEPLYFHSNRINLGKCHPDVNVIWDLAVHDFSIIEYLFNRNVSWVRASGEKYIDNKNECIAYVDAEYERNLRVHIHVSWCSPTKARSIVIGGTEGMITYDDHLLSEKIRVHNKQIRFEDSGYIYSDEGCYIPNLDTREPLLNEMDHFCYCIKENKKPLTDIDFGIGVLKCLELTDLSLQKCGAKVSSNNATRALLPDKVYQDAS